MDKISEDSISDDINYQDPDIDYAELDEITRQSEEELVFKEDELDVYWLSSELDLNEHLLGNIQKLTMK